MQLTEIIVNKLPKDRGHTYSGCFFARNGIASENKPEAQVSISGLRNLWKWSRIKQMQVY